MFGIDCGNEKETHLQASKKGLKRQSCLKYCSNNLHFGTNWLNKAQLYSEIFLLGINPTE